MLYDILFMLLKVLRNAAKKVVRNRQPYAGDAPGNLPEAFCKRLCPFVYCFLQPFIADYLGKRFFYGVYFFFYAAKNR